MKKIIALLLACLMCAGALMGCGSSEDISGTVTAKEDAESTAPTSEITEAAEATEEPLSLGRLEGGIYTNSYAGYGCELSSDWTFYSAEELQELPEAAKSAMEGSELADSLADYQQISDMKAENANDMQTVNVMYTKMSLADRVASAALSEEELADTVLAQKDSVIDAYEQSGMIVSSMDKVEVSFLGETHWALYTAGTVSEVPFYMLQVMDYSRGAYGVTLTVQSYYEDTTQDVLNMFYAVD